jgi:C-terminal processing protease CtpA/Prc
MEFESKEDGTGARVVEIHKNGAVSSSMCDIMKGDDIIEVNGARTFKLEHDAVVDLFSRDHNECTLVLQDHDLPMDQADDFVSGTTRTVVLNRIDGGLGLHIVGNEPPFQVKSIKEDSAADLSNSVFVGDVIKSVNGKSVEGLDHESLIVAIQAENPVTVVFESCEAPIPSGPFTTENGVAPPQLSRTVHLKKTGGVLGLALIDGNIVQRVQEGTPAAKTDLTEGDHIVSVNGFDVSEVQNSEEVIKRIREVGEDVYV